jgi:hypothetical protein
VATISRRALAGAVASRAVGVTNATGYLGQIGAMNGLPTVVNTPADPPTKTADDLRVKPYFILFPGAGEPGTEESAAGSADTFVDLDWPIQITAAAGDIDDLLGLVDRIHNRFFRWSPGKLGTDVFTGHLRVPPSYRPGVLTDKTVTPYRLYVPLLFQLTAHT